MYSLQELNNNPIFQPPSEWLEDIKKEEEEIKNSFYFNNFDVWEIIRNNKQEYDNEYKYYFDKYLTQLKKNVCNYDDDEYMELAKSIFWENSSIRWHKKNELLQFIELVYNKYGIEKGDVHYFSKTARRKMSIMVLRSEIIELMVVSQCRYDREFIEKEYKKYFDREREEEKEYQKRYENNDDYAEGEYKRNMEMRMDIMEERFFKNCIFRKLPVGDFDCNFY